MLKENTRGRFSCVENYKAISGYKIFAYCLMSNHIHLLLKIEKEDIDLIVKRIASSYVYWYNWKYKRKSIIYALLLLVSIIVIMCFVIALDLNAYRWPVIVAVFVCV